MSRHSSLRALLLLTAIALLFGKPVSAQTTQKVPDSRTLYSQIAAMDSMLFSAFNTGDIKKLGTMFTRDLEFYHDQSGLTSYEENIDAIRNLFDRDNGLRRELVPGSLQVFPVKDYGAIEVGEHTFCHNEGGELDCGTFPFVHVWRKEGGSWKVSRVISYGH